MRVKRQDATFPPCIYRGIYRVCRTVCCTKDHLLCAERAVHPVGSKQMAMIPDVQVEGLVVQKYESRSPFLRHNSSKHRYKTHRYAMLLAVMNRSSAPFEIW